MKRKSIFALVFATVMAISGLASAQISSLQFRIDGETYAMTEVSTNVWHTLFYVDAEEAARNGSLQTNIDFEIGDLSGGTNWMYCFYVNGTVSIPETGLTALTEDQAQVYFGITVDDQTAGLYDVTLDISTGDLDFVRLGDGILGDVNIDGEVTVLDALLISQDYVGKPMPAQYESSLGDVNCDGELDAIDALLISQYYVGIQAAIDIVNACAAQ